MEPGLVGPGTPQRLAGRQASRPVASMESGLVGPGIRGHCRISSSPQASIEPGLVGPGKITLSSWTSCTHSRFNGARAGGPWNTVECHSHPPARVQLQWSQGWLALEYAAGRTHTARPCPGFNGARAGWPWNTAERGYEKGIFY